MGRTVIKDDEFPEIVDQYNSCGRKAAYNLIRDRYGIKNPYFVMTRIKASDKYTYDANTDQFSAAVLEASAEDSIFMNLDELCSTAGKKNNTFEGDTKAIVDDRSTGRDRSTAMEELVHKLISDRLLTLSRYITMDSSTRTIMIDQTSLSADGYTVISH